MKISKELTKGSNALLVLSVISKADMYGYQINRVKVPDITSRPHWNYIQTIGCTAIGSVPADSMRKIISIYDNGITFWKNGSEVGDYTLDNTIGG